MTTNHPPTNLLKKQGSSHVSTYEVQSSRMTRGSTTARVYQPLPEEVKIPPEIPDPFAKTEPIEPPGAHTGPVLLSLHGDIYERPPIDPPNTKNLKDKKKLARASTYKEDRTTRPEKVKPKSYLCICLFQVQGKL